MRAFHSVFFGPHKESEMSKTEVLETQVGILLEAIAGLPRDYQKEEMVLIVCAAHSAAVLVRDEARAAGLAVDHDSLLAGAEVLVSIASMFGARCYIDARANLLNAAIGWVLMVVESRTAHDDKRGADDAFAVATRYSTMGFELRSRGWTASGRCPWRERGSSLSVNCVCSPQPRV